MKFVYLLILMMMAVQLGCSSVELKPEEMEITVKRTAPTSDDCKKIGAVTGTTGKLKSTSEEVLEDLKKDAARKGANFVHLLSFSDYGNAAKGEGYFCP